MSEQEGTPTAPFAVLVLASRPLPRDLLDVLGAAADRGAVLRLGRFGAVPTAGLPWSSHRRPRAGSGGTGVRAAILRTAVPGSTGPRLGRLHARYDPWVRRALESSDVVIGADPVAEQILAPSLRRSGSAPVSIPPGRAAILLPSALAWHALGAALRDAADAARPASWATVGSVLAAVRACEPPTAALVRDPLDSLRPLTHLASEWLRRGRGGAVVDLADAVRRLDAADQDLTLLDALGLSALERCAVIEGARGGPTDPVTAVDEAPVVAGRVLTAAQTPWLAGDLDHTCALATAALRLVFHPDLHAESASTPLATAPEEYLAPVRGTRVWQALCSPGPATPIDSDDGATTGPTRVLVLPGAYPRFAPPLVDALRERDGVEVRVRDLGRDEPLLRWLGVNQEIVRLRLRVAAGGATGLGEAARADLAWADVVVADWADRGAVWASLSVPRGTRLIVRVHSTDALGPWLHLLDWTVVRQALFVSDPVRDLTARALAPRAPARLRVVGNGVDLQRFRGAARDAQHRADRTIAMLGWARAVKDPVFALEVLAGLRAAEPDGGWRLRLIGPDFVPGRSRATSLARRAFRARLQEEDVRAHVDFVGETAHPERHLADVGFVLSTSLRESFHLAVVEGVAAGAVPVVRDWPALAAHEGGSRVYPPDWVVPDVAGAVERVRAFGDPVIRAEEAARAAAVVADRFDAAAFAGRVRDAVLGGPDPGG